MASLSTSGLDWAARMSGAFMSYSTFRLDKIRASQAADSTALRHLPWNFPWNMKVLPRYGQLSLRICHRQERKLGL
jgi:hypothetical protein